MDFPKFQEIFRTFRDSIVSNSRRTTINAADRDGSDVNLVGAGGAAMGEEAIAALADVNEGFWLDSSRGPKLDRLVWDRYGILRQPSAPSFVFLNFTVPTAQVTPFAIPTGTTVSTPDGIEFVTVVAETFIAGTVGPIIVLARSSLSGPDKNVDAGSINSITSQVVGSPVGFSVTTTAAASGGAPAETDAQLRARARKFWTSANRGTKAAIELGALSVAGVVTVNAFEGLIGPAYPNRMVSLVVSDAFTDALVQQNVVVPTYAAVSQAFAGVVSTSLDDYRAFGIPVFTSVAQVALVSVILRLRFQAAAASDIDYITLLAKTAIVTWINQLAPGAQLLPGDLIAQLKAIPGLDVRGDEIASPAGIVVPTSPYQVIRTTLALVTTDNQATTTSIAAPSFPGLTTFIALGG